MRPTDSITSCSFAEDCPLRLVAGTQSRSTNPRPRHHIEADFDQRSQLDEERARIDAEIAAQAQADLENLVEQFKAHLKTGEFALADALVLLGAGTKGYAKKTRAKRGTAKAKVVGDKPRPGVTYKHPKTGDEWTALANLRRVKKWLQELAVSSGKKYENFAA